MSNLPVAVRGFNRYDAAQASDAAALRFNEPSMTQQQFKDEADINRIVNMFLKTGVLPETNLRGVFGDYINAPDSYHEALNYVIEADQAFMDLPAELRAQFNNDPAVLLTYLQNEDTKEKPVKQVNERQQELPIEDGHSTST